MLPSIAVALLTVVVASLYFDLGSACSPGRSTMSRYESQKSTPLVYKQFVPNRAENSLAASGQSEGPVARDSSRFKDLVENHNLDIVFKDEEGTGADRLMSQRCKDKLNSLAVMVMNQWPGVKLRVTESWDEDGAHADDSLHYEGRAVDLTTSDKDKSKLGMLARLAIDAGFDYVFYESRNHIHCSVKSDKSQAVRTGGCFSGDSSVQLETGERVSMESLRLGDKVLAADPVTGALYYDEVYAFLDRQHDSQTYYILQTEDNSTVAVTANHLLFAGRDLSLDGHGVHLPDTEAVFARNVRVGDSLISMGRAAVPTMAQPTLKKVVSVKVVRMSGQYAPATLGGTIVVDGVLSSCYALVNSHSVAHAALAPLRLWHYAQRTAVEWLSWPSAKSVLDDNPPAAAGANVHWYAELLLTVARTIAGDLLFK